MPLFRPSELKMHLAALNTGPKKRLSQNFLIDGNIIKKIVRLANVKSGDVILEIGPGPGALTEELLNQGALVTAIEVDPHFAEGLRKQNHPNLTVIECDILEADLSSFSNAKVVANLPYHLTSPILDILLPLSHSFESLTLMVQKEVRDRMVARAGENERSSLSVFCEFWGDIKESFVIKPTSFWPKPKVHSACLRIDLKKEAPVKGQEKQKEFFYLMRGLYTYRRKMIRASLKRLFQNSEAILENSGIEPTLRPEELTLEQFILLALASAGLNAAIDGP